MVPVKKYAKLLVTCFESDFFKAVFPALLQYCTDAARATKTVTILNGMTTVPRFSMGLMFIDSSDKAALNALFVELYKYTGDGTALKKKKVAKLAAAYKVSL